MATARKMPRVICAVLTSTNPYRDPETDYEAPTVKRNAPRRIRILTKHGIDPTTGEITQPAHAWPLPMQANRAAHGLRGEASPPEPVVGPDAPSLTRSTHLGCPPPSDRTRAPGTLKLLHSKRVGLPHYSGNCKRGKSYGRGSMQSQENVARTRNRKQPP